MLSQCAGWSDSATMGEKDQWNVSVLTVSMRTAISNLLRTFILLIVVTLIAVYREELSLTVYHQDLVTQSSSDLRIGPADKVLGTSNMLRKSLILTSSSLNSSGGSVVALLPMSGQGLNSQTTDLDEHPRWRPTNCTAYYLRANKSDRGKLKTIRFLHQWNNSPDHVVSDLARRFEQISMNTCGYHCKIEKGKTHKGADLAVFIGLGLKLDTKLPPVKGPRELWALHSEEAQFVNTPDPTAWDGLFNYSTVWIRETGLHGERWRLHYHKLSSPKTRNFAAERRAKFGPALANALWFVSNCIYDSFWAPSSGRVSYALELGKNIEVNAFSRKKAGSYFCTGPLASIQKTAKQNEQPAFDEYLFYLSFENSLCRDYITEKFWKILQADTYTIPIVLGKYKIDIEIVLFICLLFYLYVSYTSEP